MKNKFEIGEIVIYKNQDNFELGVVKEVIVKSIDDRMYSYLCKGCEYEKHCHEKCETCDDYETLKHTLNPLHLYRIWYHTGDTTALTEETNLYKIQNAYAFTILRKQVDPDINAVSTHRILAASILDHFEFYGDMYYLLEDWLTLKLQGENPEFPIGIDGEYLRCALRIELRDLNEVYCHSQLTTEDLENCVEKIINHNSVNVLDMEFILEILLETMEEKENA